MKIKIKYHTDFKTKIEPIPNGDWIDLRAAETVYIQFNEYRNISLGVSMELPEGYEAHIVPRSSTFKRWGILPANGVSVIDNSYNGDDDVWYFPAFAVRDALIYKGDRICQFRIIKKMDPIEFEEVEILGNTNRGGFGSTGKD